MKKLMFTFGFVAVAGLFTANMASAKTSNDRYPNGFRKEKEKVVVVVKKAPIQRHEEVKVVKYESRGRFDRGPDRYRYEKDHRYYDRHDPRCR